MAVNNEWKQREGVVFSTNTNFSYETDTSQETPETLPAQQQLLQVRMERAGRKGKTVTLVSGFVGQSVDLQALGKFLRTKLSTGGSVKDGEIIIQGDVRERVKALLRAAQYKVVG